jgi:hypothetical protein
MNSESGHNSTFMSSIAKSNTFIILDMLFMTSAANDSVLIFYQTIAIGFIYSIKRCTHHNFSPAHHLITLIKFSIHYPFIFYISVHPCASTTVVPSFGLPFLAEKEWINWRNGRATSGQRNGVAP